MRENRRVAELIVAVQRLSRQAASSAVDERNFWTLEGDPNINLVMERPLHPLEESEAPTFSEMDFAAVDDDALEAELDELAQQFYVDEALLAQRIDRELEDRSKIALTELMDRYPITKGLPEVVGYLSLAISSERHSVSSSTIDLVTIEGVEAEARLTLKLPQVVFHR